MRAYQEVGKQEARLVSGGGRPQAFDKGYYVEPTIFADVDNSARIAREEILARLLPSFPLMTKPTQFVSPTIVHLAWPRQFGRAIFSARCER